MYESMKGITAYCGEDFDPNDPSRILRVVRDFVKLFEKALGDIKVRRPDKPWWRLALTVPFGSVPAPLLDHCPGVCPI